MKTKKKIKNSVVCLYNHWWKRRLYRMHEHYIQRCIDQLKEVKTLSGHQQNEAIGFWQDLIGEKISLRSHKYFYSRTGLWSKEYVPTYIYHVDLVPLANKLSYRDALADKNMCDILLPEVRHPHTVLKVRNGYYYIEDKAVSREEAERFCSNIQGMMIKPTLDAHGRGIRSLDVSDGITSVDGLKIGRLFDRYNQNFQIQERLQQHPIMAALNPTSVNTIRILTYRSGMEVLIVYAVIRIGRLGQVVDNQTAGGISTRIDESGRLGSFSYGGYSEDNITETDSGIAFAGYEVPSFSKACDTVRRLHLNLPFFDLVGWDIAIDYEGECVLLEWNANSGLSQSAFGPGFGKYTERIVRELWARKDKSVNL